jgi:hypothetical protein
VLPIVARRRYRDGMERILHGHADDPLYRNAESPVRRQSVPSLKEVSRSDRVFHFFKLGSHARILGEVVILASSRAFLVLADRGVQRHHSTTS